MPGAVVYCRISDDAAGSRLGVTRQEEDCRAFCAVRGWPVVEVLVDNDVSAYSGRRRPGYEQLLDGIRAGRWSTVVVWHPDRLHRRPVELEEFIDLVEAHGIAVASVTAGDFDLATPEGRLTARITGSVARKESEDKSRRLRRKHVELAQAGKLAGGGRRPFGYEPDRVTIREAEAAEIRAAVATILAGGSVRSIVTDWNDRGVPTVSGGLWAPTTVRRLLERPRLAGLREHHGEVVAEAVWPAIISPDDLTRVRALLARRDGSNPRRASTYLLTGLITCGGCGHRFSSQPVKRRGHTYRRYACPRDRGGCGRVGIQGDRLEELVVDAARARLAATNLDEKVRAAAVDVDHGTDEVASVDDRLAELAEIWARGDISQIEWAAARRALEARRAQAALQVTAAARQAAAGAAAAADWDTLTIGQRRTVLRAVIDDITVAPTTRAQNRFDPGRVTITWA